MRIGRSATVPRFDEPMSRRAWLAATAAGCLVGSARGGDATPAPDDVSEGRAIEEMAKNAGLGPFRSGRTEHFLGIGDATDTFREEALQVCEALARDYLSHFRFKGFEVERPEHRLTIVTLADADSFAAFTGQPVAEGVGGHYDLDTNRLVIFNNRPQGRDNPAQAIRDNLVALAHEATHQLTFNSGLLARDADVPVCISEGLATYAEVRDDRRPAGSFKLGQVNRRRLAGLALATNAGEPWIPVDRLLVDDALFFEGDGGQDTVQLAYAESWILIYLLMKPARPSAFRAYLAALRDRRDPAHRLEDARAHLGDLDQLDLTLRRAAGL